jgi:hypothetical protein
MNFIYSDDAEDVIVQPIILNGREGGVSLTDSDDDLDITFEDLDTAKAWVKKVRKGIKKLEAKP